MLDESLRLDVVHLSKNGTFYYKVVEESRSEKPMEALFSYLNVPNAVAN